MIGLPTLAPEPLTWDTDLGVGRVDVGVVGEHIAHRNGVARNDAGLDDRIARIGVGRRDRRIIGAGDGDGQRRRRGGAVEVHDRVGEHLGGGRALRDRVGVPIGVVQRVEVAAVGVDDDGAVDADHRRPDGPASDRRDRPGVAGVDIGIVGKNVAGGGRSPAKGMLPGLTPASTTGSSPFASAAATGASLVPVMVTVITWLAVPSSE